MALERAGVQVVPFDTRLLLQVIIGYAKIMFANSSDEDMLGVEAPLPEYGPTGIVEAMPNWLARILGAVAKRLGYKREALFLDYIGISSAAEYGKAVKEMLLLQHQLDAQWREMKIDALICPGSTLPALKHGESEQLALSFSATSKY